MDDKVVYAVYSGKYVNLFRNKDKAFKYAFRRENIGFSVEVYEQVFTLFERQEVLIYETPCLKGDN